MTAALVFAAMLCMADAPAKSVALEFKDAATYENRPVLQYRAIEFRDWPRGRWASGSLAPRRVTVWCPWAPSLRRP